MTFSNEHETLATIMSRFLFQYRTTRQTTTGETPAKLMFNRDLRTRLTLLQETRHGENLEVQKKYEKGARETGEAVMARNYTGNGRIWTRGEITKKVGTSTYLVAVEGNTWKRHSNQLHRLEKESRSNIQKHVEDVTPAVKPGDTKPDYLPSTSAKINPSFYQPLLPILDDFPTDITNDNDVNVNSNSQSNNVDTGQDNTAYFNCRDNVTNNSYQANSNEFGRHGTNESAPEVDSNIIERVAPHDSAELRPKRLRTLPTYLQDYELSTDESEGQ
ncbi:hypothetical protein NQ315_002893, partial [Exocentrus adspersus]